MGCLELLFLIMHADVLTATFIIIVDSSGAWDADEKTERSIGDLRPGAWDTSVYTTNGARNWAMHAIQFGIVRVGLYLCLDLHWPSFPCLSTRTPAHTFAPLTML